MAKDRLVIRRQQTETSGDGQGVESFIELNDTPVTYAGEAGKIVAVRQNESGLEFIELNQESKSPYKIWEPIKLPPYLTVYYGGGKFYADTPQAFWIGNMFSEGAFDQYVNQGLISHSSGDGRIWEVNTETPFFSNNFDLTLNVIDFWKRGGRRVYGKNEWVARGFVAGGTFGIYKSKDGKHWVNITDIQTNTLGISNTRHIFYANNKYFTVKVSTPSIVATSPNAVDWVDSTLINTTPNPSFPQDFRFNEIEGPATNYIHFIYGNGMYFLIFNPFFVLRSTDEGNTFETIRYQLNDGSFPSYFEIRSSTFGKGKFLVTAISRFNSQPRPFYTTNFQDITPVNLPIGIDINLVCYGNGIYVATSSWRQPWDIYLTSTLAPSRIFISEDLENWEEVDNPLPFLGFNDIAYGNGNFVIVGRYDQRSLNRPPYEEENGLVSGYTINPQELFNPSKVADTNQDYLTSTGLIRLDQNRKYGYNNDVRTDNLTISIIAAEEMSKAIVLHESNIEPTITVPAGVTLLRLNGDDYYPNGLNEIEFTCRKNASGIVNKVFYTIKKLS